MKARMRIAQALVGVGTCLAVVGASAGAAHAAGPYPYAGDDDIGRRLTVCAESLDVHDLKGWLEHRQTFTVQSFPEANKTWVYGFAWGNVNAHGYVLNGWFCDA